MRHRVLIGECPAQIFGGEKIFEVDQPADPFPGRTVAKDNQLASCRDRFLVEWGAPILFPFRSWHTTVPAAADAGAVFPGEGSTPDPDNSSADSHSGN